MKDLANNEIEWPATAREPGIWELANSAGVDMSIAENCARLREEIPEDVTIVLPCKTRTPEQMEEGIDAEAADIGENDVQKAISLYRDKFRQLRALQKKVRIWSE